jgi:Kef-type K+ transport system membrane component KefB
MMLDCRADPARLAGIGAAGAARRLQAADDGLLARAFGGSPGTALRTALALAQGGEFGFVILSQASGAAVIGEGIGQPLLAAMVLSMIATPS